jgi:hypothetical protein
MLILFALSATPPAPWQNPAAWPRLRQGLRTDQVRGLLGEPAAQENTQTRLVWYYQAVPAADDQGRPQRPTKGIVVFSECPEGWRVLRWTEPNWLLVEGWEYLQDRYRQELAAERQQTATRTPTTSPVFAKPKPQRPPQPAVPSPYAAYEPPANPTPPALPDEQVQRHTRYWFTAAWLFGAMALLFAIAQGCKYLR